nr:hypothetical protein [Candidatus Sigynarchaeota archaeon]
MVIYRCGICSAEADGLEYVRQCGICKTLVCPDHYESGACTRHFPQLDEDDRKQLKLCQARIDKATPGVMKDSCCFAAACMVPASISMLLFTYVLLNGAYQFAWLVAILITAILVGSTVVMAITMTRRVQGNRDRRQQERAKMAEIFRNYALVGDTSESHP